MNFKTSLQSLLDQRETVTSKLGAARYNLEDRLKESEAAALASNAAIALNVRGLATDEQVAAAKAKADEARLSATAAGEMVAAIEQQASAINDEIQYAEQALEDERRKLASQLARKVEEEISGNKKLRADLCKLHALWNSSVSGLVDWSDSLRDAFPPPSAMEMESAYGAVGKLLDR